MYLCPLIVVMYKNVNTRAQTMHFFEILFDIATNSDTCAQGFPDMDLITNRATPNDGPSGEVGTTAQENDLFIMNSMSFNCTGNIVSLILRAEIRTVTGSGTQAGISYPTISLWNLGLNEQMDRQVYTKVNGSERSIVLGPSNFSTSGVIEYPLDPPIEFEEGNMLAWLQQEEVVHMYWIDEANIATIGLPDNLDPLSTVVDMLDAVIANNQALMIYPVTGELVFFLQIVYCV